MNQAHGAGVIIAVVGMALVMTACGGVGRASSGSPPNAAGSPNSTSAVAYSACVRSHGVANYPDPDSSGQPPKVAAQQFGVSTSQYQAAELARRHLLTASGSLRQQEQQCMQNSDCPQALVQRMLTVDRLLARCMRSHGAPSFPDPDSGGHLPKGDAQHLGVSDVSKAGISEDDTRSSRWTSSDRACERLVGIDGDAPVDLG